MIALKIVKPTPHPPDRFTISLSLFKLEVLSCTLAHWKQKTTNPTRASYLGLTCKGPQEI